MSFHSYSLNGRVSAIETEEKTMSQNIDDYVFVNKRILKLVGLYPINYSRYFACLFSMLLIVFPQASQLYFDRGDFAVVLETRYKYINTFLFSRPHEVYNELYNRFVIR